MSYTQYIPSLKKGRIDKKIAYSLWEQGMSDAEIAEACGVTKDSAANWRRRNQLKPNVKRPDRKRSGLEFVERIAKIEAEAREHGMHYGQYRGGGYGTSGR